MRNSVRNTRTLSLIMALCLVLTLCFSLFLVTASAASAENITDKLTKDGANMTLVSGQGTLNFGETKTSTENLISGPALSTTRNGSTVTVGDNTYFKIEAISSLVATADSSVRVDGAFSFDVSTGYAVIDIDVGTDTEDGFMPGNGNYFFFNGVNSGTKFYFVDRDGGTAIQYTTVDGKTAYIPFTEKTNQWAHLTIVLENDTTNALLVAHLFVNGVYGGTAKAAKDNSDTSPNAIRFASGLQTTDVTVGESYCLDGLKIRTVTGSSAEVEGDLAYALANGGYIGRHETKDASNWAKWGYDYVVPATRETATNATVGNAGPVRYTGVSWTYADATDDNPAPVDKDGNTISNRTGLSSVASA